MPKKSFTRFKHLLFSGSAVLLTTFFGLAERSHAQVLVSQNFTGQVATGWTATDVTSSGTNWVFDNPYGWDLSGGSASFDGDFAIFDSDNFCNDNEEGTLESPTFDASQSGVYLLNFDNSFYVYSGDESALVEVWNGTAWVAVLTMAGTDGNNGYPKANHKMINITTATGGSSTAKVRFHYVNGNCDWYWAVDNVVVKRVTCTPPSATFATVPDCTNQQFSVSVNVTSMGDATGLTLGSGSTTFGSTITTTGTYTAGPFASASSPIITVTHGANADCSIGSDMIQYYCPAPNDECATPVTMVPASGNVITPLQAHNFGASGSSIPVPSCASSIDNDVWFQFTANGTENIVQILSADAGNNAYYGLGMAAYSGSCGTLTELDCNEYAYENFFGISTSPMTLSSLTAGQTYYIRVWTSEYDTDPSAAFAIGVSANVIPTNDSAAGAQSITVGAPCSGLYSNVNATLGTGEPYPACNDVSEGEHSVWFKFVAPSSGGVKITTDIAPLGTLSDTKIGLFSATDSSDYTTFTLIGCDEDNGVIGSGYASTIFATGLTAGQTYYVEVDGYSSSDAGSFCLEVTEINPTMISNSASCADLQTPVGSASYTGWVTLVDENGKLVAAVHNSAGGAANGYSGSYNIDGTGFDTPRQDGNGTYYLSRNYMITNADVTTPVDVRFFFHAGEIATLSGITSNATNLSNLNVTKQESNTCNADFDQSLGATSVLTQTGNGTLAGVSWIEVNTSSFSNFYLMGGTIPLPIKLQSITARNAGAINEVQWKTAEEAAGDYFELERSGDGKTFTFLSRINAKEKPSDYIYYDKEPLAGLNVYRLKLANRTGNTAYSRNVSATVDPAHVLAVNAYPNPADKRLTIKVSGSENGTVTLSDVSGRVVYSSRMNGSELQIDMAAFTSGVYLLHYVDGALNKVIKVHKQ